jgi:DNA-binding IscR family transcriptional regulator
MELTPTVRCALRILLAATSDPQPLANLIEASRASVGLAERTVASLCRAQLLRQIGDGYRLGFTDHAIHLSDVFRAMGLQPGPAVCPVAAAGCTDAQPCPLCWTLIEADIAALEIMRAHTLAELKKSFDLRESFTRCA